MVGLGARLIECGLLVGMILLATESIAESGLVVTLDRAIIEAIANVDWLDANEHKYVVC